MHAEDIEKQVHGPAPTSAVLRWCASPGLQAILQVFKHQARRFEFGVGPHACTCHQLF